MKTIEIDERRVLVIPGNKQETISYAAQLILKKAQDAINDHGFFAIALSGGSTPKLVYQALSSSKQQIAWDKVYLFWSDERSVPPNDPMSNYHMAIVEGGLEKLPIKKENIFRMQAEDNIEENALKYEKTIKEKLKNRPFDLILLGVGEDGHTASLFPDTEALHEKNRLVIQNYVPQKKTWRMTFTFECINAADEIHFYLLGESKADILEKVLAPTGNLPSQKIGTPTHKATFIADTAAINLSLGLKD